MISSVLIANRGEIACRITRTAKKMGMRVIAVFSEADRDALHVQLADEAYLIGPAPAAQSYLAADKILEVAAESRAQCIHPGYGFLSENAGFAQACADNGIIFVGPPASAIEAMGLKDAAKALMDTAGVPVVPGYQGSEQNPDYLATQAGQVGYPVLIKAIAGGGGKGMRRVGEPVNFAEALASCCREAKSAFNDDRVLIEKYIQSPRHIEVQVFCDTHGAALHLFERDCSMQRRHQKVIEEAPAPGMTPAMREKMCQAAVNAAKAVDYVGAGTVEFIVDASKGLKEDEFYFMEMNTRLQVEHPVTEAITGVDLVEWQFLVASQQPLPCKQGDLAINGHAIEARIYAEDPASGFLPQIGTLHRIDWPTVSQQVRVDTGVKSGTDISPYYDPMIAKVICHAEDRTSAIAQMHQTLDKTRILGLRSNILFNKRLVSSREFRAATHDTGTIDANLENLAGIGNLCPQAITLAFEVWLLFLKQTQAQERYGPWQALQGWALSGTNRTDQLTLLINGIAVVGRIGWLGNAKQYQITTEDNSFDISTTNTQSDGSKLSALFDGEIHGAHYHFSESEQTVFLNHQGMHYTVSQADLLVRSQQAGAGALIARAPMSGRIIEVSVKPGQSVKQGQVLAILEAMKMEHPLTAGMDAVVESINASINDQVDEGTVIVELTDSD